MNVRLDQQNLIKILGIESLPDERKLELVGKVSALVEKRLFLKLLNSLSNEQRKEFENILDSENQEAISLFIEKNAPKMPEWIVDEVGKVKQELADLATAA